ncbi:MAG: hypothetical protein R6X20_06605 [Phycisphaerae bacterium]
MSKRNGTLSRGSHLLLVAGSTGILALLAGCNGENLLDKNYAWVAEMIVEPRMNTPVETIEAAPVPSAETVTLGELRIDMPEGWEVGDVRPEVDETTGEVVWFMLPIHSVPGLGECRLMLQYTREATWPIEPVFYRKAVEPFYPEPDSFFGEYASDLDLFETIHNQLPGIMVYVRSRDIVRKILARLALKQTVIEHRPAKRLDTQRAHAFLAIKEKWLVAEVFDEVGRFRGLITVGTEAYARGADGTGEDQNEVSIAGALAPAAKNLLGPELATPGLTRRVAMDLAEEFFLQILANAHFAPSPEGKKPGFRFVPAPKSGERP